MPSNINKVEGSPATPSTGTPSIRGTTTTIGQTGAGPAAENPSDENALIMDQDQTTRTGLDASEDLQEDEREDINIDQISSEGNLIESAGSSFGRPEGTTAEQIDRANLEATNISGEDPDADVTDSKEEEESDLGNTYFNTHSSDDLDDKLKEKFNNSERGHSTGAFTDLGEGRSSVIRRAKKPRPQDNRH